MEKWIIAEFVKRNTCHREARARRDNNLRTLAFLWDLGDLCGGNEAYYEALRIAASRGAERQGKQCTI
jgi:hypothetical protein